MGEIFVFMDGSTRSTYYTYEYNVQQVYSLYKHLFNGVYSSRALCAIYTWESASPSLGVWCTHKTQE
jgi:hypothetical protein